MTWSTARGVSSSLGRGDGRRSIGERWPQRRLLVAAGASMIDLASLPPSAFWCVLLFRFRFAAGCGSTGCPPGPVGGWACPNCDLFRGVALQRCRSARSVFYVGRLN